MGGPGAICVRTHDGRGVRRLVPGVGAGKAAGIVVLAALVRKTCFAGRENLGADDQAGGNDTDQRLAGRGGLCWPGSPDGPVGPCGPVDPVGPRGPENSSPGDPGSSPRGPVREKVMVRSI